MNQIFVNNAMIIPIKYKVELESIRRAAVQLQKEAEHKVIQVQNVNEQLKLQLTQVNNAYELETE